MKKPKNFKHTWIAEAELHLENSDEAILRSSTGWLNDKLIDAAQLLLTEVSPVRIPGFQSVAIGIARMFDVQDGEFIQILNTGEGHWVTVSAIGKEHPRVNVYYYDSMYSTASTDLQEQVASILSASCSVIILDFINVPLQSGSSDCGLYAIANATALVMGKNPASYQYSMIRSR